MPTFQSSPPYEHGSPDSLGVLLVNLGTPDQPTPGAVRRYLREFLSDPRVVELPRALWLLALYGVVLPFRPLRSAHAYQKIWTDQGSPLLRISEDIASALQEKLSQRFAGPVHAALGMSYGSPSIPTALDRLYAEGAKRIVVLPLYPQYSSTTTGSVFDATTAMLSKRRWVPELRFINHYHDSPGYIAALAASVTDHWEQHGRGDKLLLSFHGIPKQTLINGDPYHCQCLKTARLLANSLQLDDEDWLLAFQSRLGRGEWLRPYADETIAELGRNGLGHLDVLCPGFAADCLETLEETAMQNRDIFHESGGGDLRYIPALNARDDHVAFLARLIEKHAGGWPESSPDWSESEAARERDRSRERALTAGAER
ncbi:MAG: ferrochelatase [Woeseiaceae bacterium]|nr:ferrochelatase [Woeseiaceae bacterium]